MGQKVSPHGLRVGVIKDWDSKWYADKNKFADYLIEDNKVREFVKKKLYAAGVSKVVLESQKSGIGCTAHSRKHRSGSRKKSFFQKSNEAGYRKNNESRSKGNQGSHIRKTWRS